METLHKYFDGYSNHFHNIDGTDFCGVTVDKLSTKEISIGRLKKSCDAIFAIVRQNAMWFAPRTGSDVPDLDSSRDAIAIVFFLDDGIHLCITGELGHMCMTTFKHSSKDTNIVMSCINDSTKAKEVPLVMACDTSAHDSFAKCIEQSVMRVRGLHGPSPVEPAETALHSLGYCSWNGLGKSVTLESLEKVLGSLQSCGVRPRTVIIDDGWQDTKGDRKLCSFRADASKFPLGLKSSVAHLKSKFPYIMHVGVWSTVNGYWNGIYPGSELDQEFKTLSTNAGLFVHPNVVDKFFHKYFSYLRDCGISLLKMDNQVVLTFVNDPAVRNLLWQTHCPIVEHLGKKYFGSNFIYCMAMVPTLLSFVPGWSAAKHPKQPILRNSDDFFPNIADSHAWHMYTNFYNCLYTRHMSAYLDFDMFQTRPPPWVNSPERAPAMHAAARCLSGGPIYITDAVGYHDSQLIRQMAYPGKSGDFILQFPQPPIPISIYTPFEAKTLHWVYNYKGERSLVVGAFNFSHECIGEDVMIAINSAVQRVHYSCQKFAVRSHKSSSLVDPTSAYRCLAPLDFDLFTVAPIHTVKHSQSIRESEIACFGMVSHMTGILALDGWQVRDHGFNKVCASIRASAGGYCAIYVSRLPSKIEIVPARSYSIKGQFIEILFDHLDPDVDVAQETNCYFQW